MNSVLECSINISRIKIRIEAQNSPKVKQIQIVNDTTTNSLLWNILLIHSA